MEAALNMKTVEVQTGHPAVRRVRRQAAQWRALINAYSSSGLSAQAFCRKQGLALSSFKRWHKRLHSSATAAAPETSAAPFLPVPLVSSGAAGIEVRVAGMDVHLHGSHAAEVLQLILARLGDGQ